MLIPYEWYLSDPIHLKLAACSHFIRIHPSRGLRRVKQLTYQNTETKSASVGGYLLFTAIECQSIRLIHHIKSILINALNLNDGP